MRTDYGSPSKLTYAGDMIKNEGGRSASAKENIYAGRVIGYVGTTMLGFQHPSANKVTFSGAMVTANVINGNVTVKTFDANQVEVITTLAIVPVTFAADSDSTFLAIKSAIEILNPKLTATIDITPNTRALTVTHSDGAVILLDTFVVTGGAGQVTATYQFNGTIVGPVSRQPLEAQSDGTVYAKPTTVVYALTQGIMTVLFVDASNLGSSLAIQHIANGSTAPRGSIRNNIDSGKATSFTTLKVELGANALGLGNVETNTP